MLNRYIVSILSALVILSVTGCESSNSASSGTVTNASLESQTVEEDRYTTKVNFDNITYYVPENAKKITDSEFYKTTWGYISIHSYEKSIYYELSELSSNDLEGLAKWLYSDDLNNNLVKFVKTSVNNHDALYVESKTDDYCIGVIFESKYYALKIEITSNDSMDDARKHYDEFISHLSIDDPIEETTTTTNTTTTTSSVTTTTTPKSTTIETTTKEKNYITCYINHNTKKVHKISCRFSPKSNDEADENWEYIENLDIDWAVQNGYEPCEVCNPWY